MRRDYISWHCNLGIFGYPIPFANGKTNIIKL